MPVLILRDMQSGITNSVEGQERAKQKHINININIGILVWLIAGKSSLVNTFSVHFHTAMTLIITILLPTWVFICIAFSINRGNKSQARLQWIQQSPGLPITSSTETTPRGRQSYKFYQELYRCFYFESIILQLEGCPNEKTHKMESDGHRMLSAALSAIATLLREWSVSQWFSEFWNIWTVFCNEAIKNRVNSINVETQDPYNTVLNEEKTCRMNRTT